MAQNPPGGQSPEYLDVVLPLSVLKKLRSHKKVKILKSVKPYQNARIVLLLARVCTKNSLMHLLSLFPFSHQKNCLRR